MTFLEIHVPETWAGTAVPGTQDPAGEPCPWLLRDGRGVMLRSGRDILAALPRAQHCTLVLPAGRVLLGRVALPPHNRKKFLQALPYAVEDQLMVDPETVHVVAAGAPRGDSLAVAMVERAWLGQVLTAFQGAGLAPERAEVETLLLPHREGEWTVIWRGDGGVIRQGDLEGMALDAGEGWEPPVALRLALDEAEPKPGVIRVHPEGGDAVDVARWSAVLGVQVEQAEPWDWSAQPVEVSSLNLLQGEFAPRGPRSDWLPRLRPALALAGALAVAQVAFTVLDWALLRHEKGALNAEMENSFRKAFPSAKVVVDAPLQMRRNLVELRHGAGQADPGDLLPLLGRVAPLLGRDARLKGFEFEQGRLTLRLVLADPAALDALRGRVLRVFPQAGVQAGGGGSSELEARLTIGG